ASCIVRWLVNHCPSTSCLLLVYRSAADAREFHPAILRAPFKSLVGRLRPRFAETGEIQARGRNLVALAERLADRGGASLRQNEIILLVANAVGVPYYRQPPRRVLGHHVGDFLQHRLRLLLDAVAREIKVNAVDHRPAFLTERLLDALRRRRRERQFDHLEFSFADVPP